MLARALKYFGGGIILIFMIAGCSSSSFSGRYNKTKSRAEQKETGARFSSENDKRLIARKKKNKSTYSDPRQSEFDEPPVEDYKIDSKEFIKKYKYLEQLGNALTPREKLLFEIVKYLDTPYKYGGNSLSGIDCSAFTQNVYAEALNIKLPRTASEQFGEGNPVEQGEFEFGDLIFFNTTTRKYPGHVGIYLGNDLFAHASQSRGVIISSLNSAYYKKRLIGAKRVASFDK